MLKSLTPSQLLGCAVMLLLVLSACGDGAAQGSGNRGESDSDSVTSVPTPSPEPIPIPEPTSTSEIQFPADTYPLTGTIVEVNVDGKEGSIHIIEHPDDPYAGEQYIVGVGAHTDIAAWTATGAEPRLYDDLEVGMRVVVSVDGAIATSYPALAGASHVFIMRSETDGPANPEDTVTVTFMHSLFTGYTTGDPIPPGDAFYLSYSIAGVEHDQIVFCDDDSPAPAGCEGYGGTYEVRVDVPRGSELEYAVYRVLGTGPDEPELVEGGREIIDADWATRSHYRYGAENPGGYE